MKEAIWFNGACLGPSSSHYGNVDTAQSTAELLEAYEKCSRWVATWCGVDPERVFLTDSATDGCDALLTVRSGVPDWIAYTDMAHESIRQSVLCAAEWLGEVSGHRISTWEVQISDLFSLPPLSLSAELVRRLDAISSPGTGVTVLEHVTSEAGMLLPLNHIHEAVRRRLPKVELVVDGAQSVGLWCPPEGLNVGYFGCFHKYVDAPVGTGFCVLPPSSVGKAPRRLRATQSWLTTIAGEHLPTTDVCKWIACQRAIELLEVRASCEARAAAVLRSRSELLQQVPAEFKARLSSICTEYLSHIVALRADNFESDWLWQFLSSRGFSTKRLDQGVRITLHDTMRPEALHQLGEAFREMAGGVR